MADKWTIAKIACLAVAAGATVGATIIGAKQDIAEELPKLADNSKDVIDAVAKNMEES